MCKIHLIMPMAGRGARFYNGYLNLPKPLINLKDKPFFYWAVQSILKFIDVEDVIFIVLEEHIDKFSIDKKILEYYPDAKFQVLNSILNGAVLSCLEGIKKVNDNLPVLFNDCDHAFICNNFYEFCKKKSFENVDGGILTFTSNNPSYSYVKINPSDNVIKTVEKEVISDKAICGAYYFRNKYLFEQIAKKYLNNCNYTEFFMSGLYNYFPENSIIKTFSLNEHISFGNIEEYEIAINNDKLEKLL